MTKEALKLALEALAVKFSEGWHEGIKIDASDIMLLNDAAQALAEQEPVLQDIEQYRLQMAGISTAAIGYWKEGDGIHPDYDTLALRDVAKLYAKYDALYKSQPVPHAVIAGALFDFMGWLTSRKERLVLSSADEASPAVDAIRDFAKMRGLSLDDAKVQDWNTSPPAQRSESSGKPSAWVGLTDEDEIPWDGIDAKSFAKAIEAKLRSKNGY